MKKTSILFFLLLLICSQTKAQVKTNFNNTERVNSKGYFNKSYLETSFQITPPNLATALQRDKTEDSIGSKIFYIAEPIEANINISKLANWVSNEKYSYGKFKIIAKGAKTLSINFSNFFLPKGTEMFIYNKEAEMITGVITEKENNENKIWGSSIYKGDEINIEIKIPIAGKEKLSLFITNVAFGYKDIFINKIAGFGLSGACNINVLCPLGNGWEPERNSVVFIARSDGRALCSGAMLMNTCATNIPYVLTADHCFQGDGNVAGWRVHFQAWSASCTPSQNSDGILFNGSTLRANWQPSDFCLVQLNQTPPANSGIRYAGWSRQTNAASSGVGIHHPAGDVMKISNFTTPLVREDNPARCNVNPVGQLHWVVQWNQGVTEGGSSGSPLFDQNHRIVGQLSGGPSSCPQPANCRLDMYGRFDNSWTGGGTNSTRLSNWLDPNNSNVTTTNTTNVASLLQSTQDFSLSENQITLDCSTKEITASLPLGTTITWTTNSGQLIDGNPSPYITNYQNTVSITNPLNYFGIISASITNGLCTKSSTNNIATCETCFTWDDNDAHIVSAPILQSDWLIASANSYNGANKYQWFFNGTMISETFTPYLQISPWPCFDVDPRNLYVVAVTSCGRSLPANAGEISLKCFGNRSSVNASNVVISPNPAFDKIKINLAETKNKSLKSIKEIRSIIITDNLGIVKITKTFGKNTNQCNLQIGNLVSGIYNVRISDGIITDNKTIVKK